MRQCPKCGRRFLTDDRSVCDADGTATEGVLNAFGKERLVRAVVNDRYEIESILGDGGMGVVYRAHGLVDGLVYAMKVLRAEYTDEQELVQRFQQEAEAVYAIQHHNIVRVFDFGALPDDSRYFVMEYLPGESLGRLLAAQQKLGQRGHYHPLPEALTLHIARQICAGLAAAHALGIVHRDMKPDNVHLVPAQHGGYLVKILDFGIAKVQGAQSARTRTGSVFGTPHYMSPEQAQGERDIDPRTDVYATGVLLYQMTCGHVPFDADNLMGILTQHLYQHAKPPRLADPTGAVSEALEAVILKALSKARDARYASMLDLDADLARIEQRVVPRALAAFDEPTTTFRSGFNLPPTTIAPSGSSAGGGVPSATGRSIPPVTASRPIARSRVPALAAGFALLGALTLSLALIVTFRRSGSSAHRAATTQEPGMRASAPVFLPDRHADFRVMVTAPPTPRVSTVHLVSDPPNATVLRDGQAIGTTPIDLPRPTNADAHYALTADARMTVPLTISPTTPSAMQVTLPPQAPERGHASRHHEHHGELLDPWSH